jgi:hypothetical protein
VDSLLQMSYTAFGICFALGAFVALYQPKTRPSRFTTNERIVMGGLSLIGFCGFAVAALAKSPGTVQVGLAIVGFTFAIQFGCTANFLINALGRMTR